MTLRAGGLPPAKARRHAVRGIDARAQSRAEYDWEGDSKVFCLQSVTGRSRPASRSPVHSQGRRTRSITTGWSTVAGRAMNRSICSRCRTKALSVRRIAIRTGWPSLSALADEPGWPHPVLETTQERWGTARAGALRRTAKLLRPTCVTTHSDAPTRSIPMTASRM